ncbi:MAG: AzlD domain-containing protein [Anaerolineae bacterium]|nr:AzlD domain-containing protein [Anaerolineae bacterium]
MEATLGLWLTILAAGVATFLIRLSFIAVHGRVIMPDWFNRALTFVPVTVLSAIIVPELVMTDGVVNFSPLNARLIAGIAAILVAWHTKNVMVTIVVGMLLLWGMQYFFG